MPVFAYAQTADLQKAFAEIENQVIAEVKTGSSTYEQKIVLQEQGVIRYEYTQTDAKGKSVIMAYEFNLADIDAYAVREETRKDLISVNLSVKNNQKLVKEYKNGEVSAYTKDLSVISSDVDNARAQVERFKKAIPAAEKLMENRLKLNTYTDMLGWLVHNVKDVAIGDKTYKQVMSAGEQPGALRFTQIEISPKTSVEQLYEFNLADLNPNTLNFKISGNRFLISLETLRKQRLIGNSKNGLKTSYTNDLEIVLNNVEEARDLRSVLALAIPLAAEKVQSSMPKLNNHADAMKSLAQLVQDFKVGDTSYEQKLEASCISNYQYTEISPKGTSASTFHFNLMDLNENLLSYEVSGSRLYIELQTRDKMKLIRQQKGEELAAYESSIKLYVPDVEVARRLKFVLEKAIVGCREGHISPLAKQTPKQRIEWLIQTVGEVSLDGKTYKQNLELPDPTDFKKIKFTQIESDSKKTTEEIFEFNLTDIDPKSVNYSIRGKWLSLTMETAQKDKIIKHYQNGQIKPYTNTLELKVNDVEKARELMAAISGLIADLKK